MPLTAIPSIRLSDRDSSLFVFDNIEALKQVLSIDFDEYNRRLGYALSAAQVQVERFTGVLLTPATVTVSWPGFYDEGDLPGGPVTGAVTATDLTGSPVTVVTGNSDFPVLTGNFPYGVTLSYPAGYDDVTIPGDLRQAAIDLAANLFDKGSRDWKTAARLHKRTTWVS